MNEKYSINDFIYWLEKYNDIYDQNWSREEVVSIIAKALINFLPDTDTRF